MDSAQRIDELRLHVTGDKIWFSEPGHEAYMSPLSPEEFVRQKVIAEANCVRLLGCRENARLISEIYSLRCIADHKLRTVLLGNPNWSPGVSDAVEDIFHSMSGQEEAPSVGGWHQITEKDYVTYALVAEFDEAGQKCTPLVDKFLRVHPAWPALSFLPGLDKTAACKLIAAIMDPRWHVNPCKPESAARLRSRLGVGRGGVAIMRYLLGASDDLLPATQRAVDNARAVLATWTGGSYVPPPQDVVGPSEFLWRVYYNVAATKDGYHGMLRASHVFLRFLRSVWLDNLTPPRECELVARRFPNAKRRPKTMKTLRMLPCRKYAPTLFVPEYFFRLTAEVEAWRRHAARCRGRTH